MKFLNVWNGLDRPLVCFWVDGSVSNSVVFPSGVMVSGVPVFADSWILSDTNGLSLAYDVSAVFPGCTVSVGSVAGSLVVQSSASPNYVDHFMLGLGFAITIGLTIWVVRLMRKVDVDSQISDI